MLKQMIDLEDIFRKLVAATREEIVDEQDEFPHYKILDDFFKNGDIKCASFDEEESKIDTECETGVFIWHIVTEQATESDNCEHGYSYIFTWNDGHWESCEIDSGW